MRFSISYISDYFILRMFVPSFQYFIVFCVLTQMSRKSWHLGTMGVEICVSCSICHMCHTMWHHGNYTNSSGTSICLRGAGIWTQPDVQKNPICKNAFANLLKKWCYFLGSKKPFIRNYLIKSQLQQDCASPQSCYCAVFCPPVP